MPDIKVHVRSGVFPLGIAINNIYVAIHDFDTKEKISSDYTGADDNDDGYVTFPDMDEGDYELRLSSKGNPGYVFTSGNISKITVADEDVFDIEAIPPSLPVAENELYCRVSGYLADAYGNVLPNKVVLVSYDDDATSIGQGSTLPIIEYNTEIKTDKFGKLSIDLLKNSKYIFKISNFLYPITIVTPDLSAANISTVLFPEPSLVEWYLDEDRTDKINPSDSPEINININSEPVTIYPILTYSSGVTVDTIGSILIDDYDEEIIETTITFSSVTITPLELGTTRFRLSNALMNKTINEIEILGELTINVTE